MGASEQRSERARLLEEEIRSLQTALERADRRETELMKKVEALDAFQKERKHWAPFFTQLLRKSGDEENTAEPNTEVLPIRVMQMVQHLQQESVLTTQKVASLTSKLGITCRLNEEVQQQLAQSQKDGNEY